MTIEDRIRDIVKEIQEDLVSVSDIDVVRERLYKHVAALETVANDIEYSRSPQDYCSCPGCSPSGSCWR